MSKINIVSNDKSNCIKVNDATKFYNSTIKIVGYNNIIDIGYSKYVIENLSIRLIGDNNKIVLSNTSKTINNLSINSSRGGNIEIYIGENFGCGGVDIRMNDGYEKLIIGDDCLFSSGIKIRTSDGHAVIDLDSDQAVNLPSDVHIGSHVWIGEDARILKGVFIPDNCVVGGFSIVTKSFLKEDKHSVIAGSPAKIVKKNINWDRRRADEVNNYSRIMSKKTILVENNKVDLSFARISFIKSWSTITFLKNVIVDPTKILEINYSYKENLNNIIFQILLWNDSKEKYFWDNINFRNSINSKGIVKIDFGKLKKVGDIGYKDVKNIEIRAKRRA